MSARRKSPVPAVALEQRHVHEATGVTITEWSGSYGDCSWRLFNGPAKETLSLLPAQSVDCCITSPPYFWLRDYKIKGQMGLEDTIDGPAVARKITDTIQRLELNTDRDYVNERIRVIRAYSLDEITMSHLKDRYPFIAQQISAQDFDAQFKQRWRAFFRTRNIKP